MENVFVLVEWEDYESSCILGVFKTLDASELFADRSERGPWRAWRATPGNASRRVRSSVEGWATIQAIEMYEVQA